MTVEFRCSDVGVACGKVTRAETADQLVEAVARHAREKHGVELNETLLEYAKTQVQTKE